MGLANAVEHCAYEPFWILFVLGALGTMLASIALGAALLIWGALGRWRGVLLVAAAAGLMLGTDRGGAAVFGVAWTILGVSLLAGGPVLER
jgi:hypothetical protein